MASTLTRPRHGKVIAGVCAGLAERFGWSPFAGPAGVPAVLPAARPAVRDLHRALGDHAQARLLIRGAVDIGGWLAPCCSAPGSSTRAAPSGAGRPSRSTATGSAGSARRRRRAGAPGGRDRARRSPAPSSLPRVRRRPRARHRDRAARRRARPHRLPVRAGAARRGGRARRARPGALVWGHGWQDQRWADAPPPRPALDRAAAGAPVYLSRIDVHSALVSSALLDRAPGVTGAPAGPPRPAVRRCPPPRPTGRARRRRRPPPATPRRRIPRRRRRPRGRRSCTSAPDRTSPRPPTSPRCAPGRDRRSSGTGVRRCARRRRPASCSPPPEPADSRATCSSTARSARAPRRCARPTPTPRLHRATATSTPTRSARTSPPAPRSGYRPGST